MPTFREGMPTPSSGSENLKMMFSQNIIFLVTLICLRVLSQSLNRSLGKNIKFIVN